MKKQIQHVTEFHKAFNCPIRETPSLIPQEEYWLRYELMEEENDEYVKACSEGDIVEIFDALGDQLYILCGTIISHGGQKIIEKVFEEIQASNMSKLDYNGQPIINGENGVFDETRPIGKVIKSENFREPDLAPIIFGQ